MDKFDGDKGFKNISYSVWWIRQMIIDALNKRNSLEAEDLPSDVDMPEKVIEDDDYSFNSEKILHENFIDEDSYEKVKNEEQLKCIAKLMEDLSEREKKIITLYYGLNGNKQKNLEEIGQVLGLTKERVRQIHNLAFKKMRQSVIVNGYDENIYR